MTFQEKTNKIQGSTRYYPTVIPRKSTPGSTHPLRTHSCMPFASILSTQHEPAPILTSRRTINLTSSTLPSWNLESCQGESQLTQDISTESHRTIAVIIKYFFPLLLLLLSCSVMSDSVRLYGRQPTRLLCRQDSLGRNTGVGCHFLLHFFPLTIQLIRIIVLSLKTTESNTKVFKR